MAKEAVHTRGLSLHERYSHVRSLLGIPHPVTFTIALPPTSSSSSSSSSPPPAPGTALDIAQLRARAAYLQTVWPHLYARVADAHTHAPKWVSGDRAWNGNEVVVQRPLPGLAGTGEYGIDVGELLQWECRDFRNSAGSSPELDGPGWRLTLYTAPTVKGDAHASAPAERQTVRYVAFSVNHILADGTGALRLFTALLGNDKYPAEGLPPALESTINIKPGLRVILPQIWTKLIRPRLPAWFQPVEDADACLDWPGELKMGGAGGAGPDVIAKADKADAVGQESKRAVGDDGGRGLVEIGNTALSERVILLDIPSSTTAALKAICKEKGITLHPVLKTAWTWAMFATIDATPSLAPLKSGGTDRREYTLSADTPRNERVPELGHGWATGNYVSGLEYKYHHPASPASSDTTAPPPLPRQSFWHTAASVASHLASPSTIIAARQKFGSLAYIPNAPNAPTEPTGWEVFWNGQRSGDRPYGGAVSVSNLGYTSLLSLLAPDGAQTGAPGKADAEGHGEGARMYWMQPAVPWGDALAVNVIGHAQGLGVTVSILDGAAVAEQDVRVMGNAFARVLERLGRGVDGYEELVAA